MNTSIVKEFGKKKILVVGDIMLDKYLWSRVTRISPEAPVQVAEVQKETFELGGAGNVASNIASLKGQVTLIGIVGNDPAHDKIKELLQKKGIKARLIIDTRPTTQKVRIIGHSQQLLRFDYESTAEITIETEKKILKAIEPEKYDCIIISDYAKGVITANIAEKCKLSKICIVDPKPSHINLYTGARLIKCNLSEASSIAKTGDMVEAGTTIMKQLQSNVVITMGDKGMLLFTKKETFHIEPIARQVSDVTGAGDTSIAILGLALSSGATLKEACELANLGASIVVGKVGTATISQEELQSHQSAPLF